MNRRPTFPSASLVFCALALGAWLALDGVFLTGRLPAGDDLLNQFLPFQSLVSEALRAGRIPHWNPWIFGGQPLMADVQIGVWYPPNWLHLIAPPGWAFGWLTALHMAWMLAGGWMLGRRLGLRPEAAALGTFLFALQPMTALRPGLGHVIYVYTLAWLPWMGWAMLGLTQRPNWGRCCLAALILAMPWLAGAPQIAFYGWALTGVAALWPPVENPAPWRSRLAWATGTIALAGTLAAIQILPTFLYMSQSFGRSGAGAWEYITNGSLRPRLLTMFLNPSFFGPGNQPTLYRGGIEAYGETCGYLPLWGIAALAAPMLWRWRRNETAPHFRRLQALGLAAAALGLILAMGKYTPIFAVFYRFVPGFDRFRVPARLMLVAVAGLAGLSALGLHQTLEAKSPKRNQIIAPAFSILIAAGAVWALYLCRDAIWRAWEPAFASADPGLAKINLAYGRYALAGALKVTGFALAGGTALAVLARARLAPAWARWAPAALAAAELVWLAAPMTPSANANTLANREYRRSDLVEAITGANGGGRILWLDDMIDWRLKNVQPEMWPNRLLMHRLSDARGYYPVRLDAYTALVNVMAGIPPARETGGRLLVPNIALPELLTTMGVDTVVSSRELSSIPGMQALSTVPGAGRSFKTWRWTGYRGLAFAAPLQIASPVEGAAWMGQLAAAAGAAHRLNEERRTGAFETIVAGPDIAEAGLALIGAIDGRYLVEADMPAPGRMEISTDFPENALLFVSQCAWDGWRAQIDGEEAPLFRVSGAFMGVAVPRGTHDVALRFETPGFASGWKLTLAALLIMALGLVRRRPETS